MAPIRPSNRKRTSIRSRADRSAKDPRGIYAPPLHPVADTTTTPDDPASLPAADDPAFTDFDGASFKVSKKDKRTIKHNQLLAKVQQDGVRKRPLKRRRPKKEIGERGMKGLEDALPGVGDGEEDGEWEGIDEDEGGSKRQTMVMKSVRTRPGALKRKSKMEKSEMERFARNLAEMAGGKKGEGGGGGGVGGESSVQAEKWKALRQFIGGTMEKSKAFVAAK